MTRNDLEKGSSDIAMLVYVLAVLLCAVIIITVVVPQQEGDQFKKFSSYQQLTSFLENNKDTSGFFGLDMSGTRVMAVGAEGASKAEDYSITNVQVEGVDEADIVKNDGKYIYVVSGKKVVIVNAYPAEEAAIISEIKLDDNPQEIFVNNDRLVVLGNSYKRYDNSAGTGEKSILPYPGKNSNTAFIKVYDISDREEPKLDSEYAIDGNYYDSRMIGNYVYVIANKYVYLMDGAVSLPVIYKNGEAREVQADEIYYINNPDTSFIFTTIMSIDLNTVNTEEKVVLTGSTQNMYVSADNIYTVYLKRLSPRYYTQLIIEKVMMPVLPLTMQEQLNAVQNSQLTAQEKMEKMQFLLVNYTNTLSQEQTQALRKAAEQRMKDVVSEISKETQKSIVQRISIVNGDIEHKAQGEVAGNVLNQFSMDEYNGNFRIATTTSDWTGRQGSLNHIYVLDENLNVIGKLEDLAPGESIYSARFMGSRAYLVTFRKVDPFFVIDLSNPTDPQLLGKLKLPGYSDYLHPYDENHVIGLGKETVEAEDGDFSWYQGVKLALFDVSDVANPKEVDKFEVGDRGTDSYALRDHKAFLFSKSKGILVVPILLAEIDEEKYNGEVPKNAYGDFVWQGAYIFSISENGFELRGRVTHQNDTSAFEKSGWYYRSPTDVKRALYMDDVLYTLSDEMIKMNNINDINEINSIKLPYEQDYRSPVYY